jgi:hypothetical protein
MASCKSPPYGRVGGLSFSVVVVFAVGEDEGDLEGVVASLDSFLVVVAGVEVEEVEGEISLSFASSFGDSWEDDGGVCTVLGEGVVGTSKEDIPAAGAVGAGKEMEGCRCSFGIFLYVVLFCRILDK